MLSGVTDETKTTPSIMVCLNRLANDIATRNIGRNFNNGIQLKKYEHVEEESILLVACQSQSSTCTREKK